MEKVAVVLAKLAAQLLRAWNGIHRANMVGMIAVTPEESRKDVMPLNLEQT